MLSRFNGLIKREWRREYKLFYITSIFLLFLIWFIPFILEIMANKNFSLSLTTLILAVVLLIIALFLLPLFFAVNIIKESANPDVWLHTPAPFWQLISAKLVFYTFVGFVQSVFLFIVALCSLNAYMEESVIKYIPFFSISLAFSIESLLFSFAYTLILISIFQLLVRYIGKYAYVVTIVISFFMIYAFGYVTNSALYTRLIVNGPSLIDNIPIPFATSGDLEDLRSTMFSIKELSFTAILIIIMAYVGIKFLERMIKR